MKLRVLAIASSIFVLAAHAPAAMAGEELPKIYLNHEYRVVSPQVIDSLDQTAFLKDQFGSVVLQSTPSGANTWRGFYFWGEHTYIELVEPNAGLNLKLGDSGLGLGDEDAGGIATVADVLDRAFPEDHPQLAEKTVAIGSQSIPWFKNVQLFFEQGFTSWVMEYDADFMKTVFPNYPEDWGITRKQYNARKTIGGATIGYDGTKLFKDIVGLEFALTPAQTEKFSRYLAGLKFRRHEDEDGTRFRGRFVTIRVVPATADRSGLLRIRMALNKRGEPAVYPMADGVSLVVHGDRTAELLLSRSSHALSIE